MQEATKARIEGKHKLCYDLCTQLLQSSSESSISLTEKEKAELYENLSICCYYVREIEQGRKYCDLVFSSCASDTIKNITVWNASYYAFGLKFKKQRRIDLNLPQGYVVTSSSIVSNSNRYILNVRTVNYKLTKDGDYIKRFGDRIITINRMVELNSFDSEIKESFVFDFPFPFPNYVSGIEDVRLCTLGEEIIYMGNSRETNSQARIQMIYGTYCNNGNKEIDSFINFQNMINTLPENDARPIKISIRVDFLSSFGFKLNESQQTNEIQTVQDKSSSRLSNENVAIQDREEIKRIVNQVSLNIKSNRKLSSLGKSYKVIEVHPGSRCEKNWIPYEYKEKLRFIYSWSPFEIYELTSIDDPSSLKQVCSLSVPIFDGSFRGSSGLIPFKDGYLAMIHQTHVAKVRKYLHRFIWFPSSIIMSKRNEDLTSFIPLIKRSHLFFFKQEGVEYSVGMTRRNKTECDAENEIIIAHSVRDEECYLSVIDEAQIEQLLY
jgi:hypothetical protein